MLATVTLVRNKHYCPKSQTELMCRNIAKSTQKVVTDQGVELNSWPGEWRLWLEAQHSADRSLVEGGTAMQPSNLATAVAPRHLTNPSGIIVALNLLNGKANASHLLAAPSVRQSTEVHYIRKGLKCKPTNSLWQIRKDSHVRLHSLGRR